MKCPECGYEDSKVIDSRPAENKIRRRRECLSCKCRFTTYEMVETIPVVMEIQPEETAETIPEAPPPLKKLKKPLNRHQ